LVPEKNVSAGKDSPKRNPHAGRPLRSEAGGAHAALYKLLYVRRPRPAYMSGTGRASRLLLSESTTETFGAFR
jgi:hypothetical protein